MANWHKFYLKLYDPLKIAGYKTTSIKTIIVAMLTPSVMYCSICFFEMIGIYYQHNPEGAKGIYFPFLIDLRTNIEVVSPINEVVRSIIFSFLTR